MKEQDVETSHFEGGNGGRSLQKPACDKSGDIAAQLVDNVVAGKITPEQDKRCLRRVDCFLMPVMFLSFALQYLDKTCLTGSALFGILTDLKLVELTSVGGTIVVDSSRYSYCSLIFYWGYLVGLIPGVILSQRFPIGKYVSVIMFLWGVVTVCTVAVTSYKGLLVQRFFLGFTEAGVSPAFSLITVMWYKRQEQPLRFAIWYSSTGLGILVGTLLLYAIGQIEGALAPWRYQFMIIGSVSSVWGVLLWFLLPDSPLTAYFLTEEMRVVAIERMRFEQIGIENKTVKWDQIREAFTDPKTYFYVVMIFAANLTNGAASGFGAIIVQSFGYSSLRTILLLGVAGVFVFVFLLLSGIICAFIHNMRVVCAMICCLPVIAGSVMIWHSDWQQSKAKPLWGFFFLAIFSTTSVMILTLMAANTAGHTKKAVTAGVVWASYCIANGIAPLTVRTEEEAGHYPSAFITILVMMSLVFVLLALFRAYIFHLNKKRDETGTVDRNEAAMTGFLDMTDRANPNFRYQA